MNTSLPPTFSASVYPAALRLTLYARLLFATALTALLLWAYGTDQPWPLLPLALVAFTLAAAGGLLAVYAGSERRHLMEWGLCIDMLVLTEWLYWSGGVTNPMVSLYLPPVLLAALLCSPRFAWLLTFFAAGAYLLLFRYHQPFPIVSDQPDRLFQIHIGGMWLTFVLSAVLITACITRLISELNRKTAELHQAHTRQQQNEQILGIGIEAAHLAHRLSTPLNSLMLLNDDWQSRRDLPAEMAEDLQLMQQLLGECRDSLWQLKPKQAAVSSEWQTVYLYQTLQTQLAQWHNLRPEVVYHWQQHSPIAPDLEVCIDPLFWSALLNILNNAADAGGQEITVETRLDDNLWTIGIRNRSGCLSESQLQAAGLNAQESDKPAGLGMGVLLSHATLARMGGSLSLSNHPSGGVYAEIRLPLTLCPASEKERRHAAFPTD